MLGGVASSPCPTCRLRRLPARPRSSWAIPCLTCPFYKMSDPSGIVWDMLEGVPGLLPNMANQLHHYDDRTAGLHKPVKAQSYRPRVAVQCVPDDRPARVIGFGFGVGVGLLWRV
jgi:hypothetical protein